MNKNYSQPLRLNLLAVFGLLFFNILLGYSLIDLCYWEDYNLYYKSYYLISYISFWMMINYSILDILLEKVTITEDSISLKSVFKRKTILISEVKGYQLKNKNIYLIPKYAEMKGISFSDNLIGENKIIDYFTRK